MTNLKKTRETVMYFGANEETQELARLLRLKSTAMENALWEKLKNRNILGVKFRRQHPISFYIADFYCHELRLVIEVDGPIHQQSEKNAKDLNRTAEFERMGITILRFTNQEVEYNIKHVILKIQGVINDIRLNLKNH